jgi:hypothetical protein
MKRRFTPFVSQNSCISRCDYAIDEADRGQIEIEIEIEIEMGQVEIRKIGDSVGEGEGGSADGGERREDEDTKSRREERYRGPIHTNRGVTPHTSPMGRRARCRHVVKINGTIAIYLVSHDNKR